jgi:two-component system, cell cycle sensor histidine kinase and response regulator CckA
MSARKLSLWFYPQPTGDPGRDRNAQTLQFTCLLFTVAIALIAILNALERDWVEFPVSCMSVAGLVAAMVMNRAGMWKGAARTAILAILLTAILLVVQARDGFRSHAMIVFPGLLLISVMLLDRVSYLATASIVLLAVAALGVAEKNGLGRTTPPMRTPTSYDSIFYVDLTLLAFAVIGSRIAGDAQGNVSDLRGNIDRLKTANRELVETKEHLEESEQRLKSAQRLTHVGSWHWNLGVNRVDCSEECKRIFGQPEDYAPSLEGLLEMVTPRDRARVANEIQRGIADKSGCSTEFQIIRPNGETRTVVFSSQLLLDEQGSPRHIFGACQDVTDDRRAQEEAFTRQKLETVGNLANGIAHDFNNLLGGVLAQAELALSELAAGSSPEEELKTICSAAASGSEIVRQLMIYSGQDREAPGLVDVARTVEQMAELLKVSISKHATLHVDLDKNLPPVRGSAAQIRQIVMNLVMNASEAIGDRDGVIRLTAQRLAVGEDRLEWIPEGLATGDYVQLQVADTGRGMSRETQARVFDPFFTTKPSGHGLGLAVVSGIVRALAGAIHLVSEPGKGTTFEVLLPSEEGTGNAIPGPNAPVRSTPADCDATALVVDDEDALRTATAKMLRTSGFSVLEAADGTAAIEAIRGAHPIEVLLLDVTLPGTSSREVLLEAKRLRPAMRVIVTSAYGEDFAALSLQGPVERFIRKPYSLSDLVKLVRQTLA